MKNVGVSFLKKSPGSDVFKNICFEENLWMTASVTFTVLDHEQKWNYYDALVIHQNCWSGLLPYKDFQGTHWKGKKQNSCPPALEIFSAPSSMETKLLYMLVFYCS